MKKFFFSVFLLAGLALGAAAYLMHYRSETSAGQWVKAQYDRLFAAQASSDGPEAAAPADEVADVPAEPAPGPSAARPAARRSAKKAPTAPTAPAADAAPPPSPVDDAQGRETAAAEPSPAEAPAPRVRKPKPFSKENWYAGKQLRADDIRGKVVLVYVWDVADARSVALLARVQQTWASFKHKPFTAIGSHRGARSEKVLRALKAKKIAFPVYQDAYLPAEPKSIDTLPYFYVVSYVNSPEGRLIHRGASDVEATEAVVNALSNAIGR